MKIVVNKAIKSEQLHKEYIDLIRGIGIILVVIGHAGSPAIVRKVIYSFHMPLFFILSGFLYNDTKWAQKGFAALVKNKAKAYVIPYFILAFINLLLNGILESRTMEIVDLLHSTKMHLFWIFYSFGSISKMPNCTPLWFLPCIFICSIYVYWLMKITDGYKRWMICIAMLEVEIMLRTVTADQLPWHIDTALVGTVLMHVGLEFRKRSIVESKYISVKNMSMFFLAGIVAIWLNEAVDMNARRYGNEILFFISAVSCSLIIMCCCYNIKHRWMAVEYIGKNTIIVMGFNYILNSLTEAIWRKIPVVNSCDYNWVVKSSIVILLLYGLIWMWGMLKNRLGLLCSRR